MSDFPFIVYKYRNWSTDFHKSVLLKNQLFLAKPSDFNDPYDCRIPTNYYLLEDNEIDSFAYEAIKVHKPDLIRAKDLNAIIHEKNEIKKRLSDRDKFQAANERLEFEGFDKYTGVLSLSARWNSLLMWAHYADCHKGYCIGFYEECLRNSRLFGRGGMVQYDKKYPEITPDPTHLNFMKEVFTKTHTKSVEWEYEEEYRIVTTSYPNHLNRLITIPQNCIAEVVLGISISDKDKKEILHHTTAYAIPTYQAIKVPFHFEMDRQQIV